ncbi:MAG: 1-acyl-sn-glycerol-3-phosphate acyltransferase [Elusimicrobia bacterium]|nr:1-acyl-sn-glycerol-3-phosphate acyltransferase [Elusimicrobiota bacterium]
MSRADADFPLRIWSEAAVRGLLTAIWGMKVTGLENVPRDGPLIIAANHVSFMDPPLVALAVAPRRRPFGVAKKELFEIPILGWWLKGLGAFPLDRRGDATSAMRAALDVLGRGGAVAIHPEGTRVKPGQTRAPKAGVSFLAARSGACVLPVRALGTAEFPFRRPLEARIGAPLPPPESCDRDAGLAYAKTLMEKIHSL